MNRILNFSRETMFGDRRGISTVTALQLFIDSKGNLNIFPVLSNKGNGIRNFTEIPKEDVPALIALLQESIGVKP